MKAFPTLPFRTAFVWLCVAILLAGWPSVKADFIDYTKVAILPEVKFKDITLDEAVAYVKQTVKKLGVFADGNLNVVIVGASEKQKKKKISLDASEISLRSAMEHIGQAVGLVVRVESYAVVLTSAAYSDKLSTRTYRMPPDFISMRSAAR